MKNQVNIEDFKSEKDVNALAFMSSYNSTQPAQEKTGNKLPLSKKLMMAFNGTLLAVLWSLFYETYTSMEINGSITLSGMALILVSAFYLDSLFISYLKTRPSLSMLAK